MDLTSLTPLEGGWSGETFLGEVAGERSVVRIYADPGDRGDAAAEIDAAVLRLVRGLLPVPEVLEVRRPDHAAGAPGLLVTSFLPGVRGDLLLPTLDEDGLARAGASLGTLVATLGGMPMLETGTFVDGSLRLEPFPLADDLPAYVEEKQGALALDPDDSARLDRVAVDAQALLDTVTRRCLVHSDVNPKNLLLDPDTLEVTGLLDWEFAHAGHPAHDLGNLLRFDREPVFVEAVLTAYVDRLGGEPDATLELARAADLFALVELASRRRDNPVAHHAFERVRAIARSGDPAAT
ncbi:phosphotransferase family protein [Nocardioides euryhalodurans]|uniref:Aminoglycoside phosphotransferase family protein n=1 Tax=Nocardioides euryhalodurans TaxID=2518370 RepID=A0A4P7GGF1_9ACTN|nr:aminoglycoside phosphotransferase family protein [Nocardioides euryhalodurans]QBR90905.1 aminoglycoside phosphotransferase family protein [Nocardioides euryhalodurans]